MFIFCVNSSNGLADKSLFEIETCIFKMLSFLMKFRNFFAKILHLKILYFSRNFRFVCIISIFFFKFLPFFLSERNAKIKRNGREKCEIFAKRFFLFFGTLVLTSFSEISL